MKKLIMAMVAAVSIASATAQPTSAPAFPGAEGHARYVTGGRGGKIVHVTNLNNTGTGSLREAVKGSDKKIVVFDVAGVIALESDLTIGDNTTIMGQTAPSPGITVRYYTVGIGANNIIRFIRFRRGQEKNINDGADACWQRNKTGIMLDHCSFSWSIDEVASFYDNNNFTMQWCTVGESLTNPGHSKGAHGYGGIWGGKLASFHHNMIIHVTNRGPRFNGARYGWNGYTSNMNYSTYNWANTVQAENVDFRNCVMYNAQGACYGGPGGGQINMVNNYYKAGPRSSSNMGKVTTVSICNEGNGDASHSELYGLTSRYYISGNTTEDNNGTKSANRDWSGVSYDSGIIEYNGERYCCDNQKLYGEGAGHVTIAGESYVKIKLDSPAPKGEVTTHTAAKAYEKVLSYVGASLYRDDVDTRYVNETRGGTATYKGSVTGTWGLIDLVSDVNGYTEATFGTASRAAGFDTDNDGMPDEWEKAHGLNPNDASDAKTYTLDEKHFYTNLEYYCNSLVEDIMKGGVADAQESVDEYWPDGNAQSQGGGSEAQGVDVEYSLSKSSYSASPSTEKWNFVTNEETISISNASGKSYGAGNEDGVKYSKGVQFTITLPSGVTLNEVTFKGYDNYNTADAYISELNGETLSSTEMVFPKKDDSGSYIVVERTKAVNATGTLTFTIGGNQSVLAITLKGKKADAASIGNIGDTESPVKSISYFSLDGKRISTPTRGAYIRITTHDNGAREVEKVIK